MLTTEIEVILLDGRKIAHIMIGTDTYNQIQLQKQPMSKYIKIHLDNTLREGGTQFYIILLCIMSSADMTTHYFRPIPIR